MKLIGGLTFYFYFKFSMLQGLPYRKSRNGASLPTWYKCITVAHCKCNTTAYVEIKWAKISDTLSCLSRTKDNLTKPVVIPICLDILSSKTRPRQIRRRYVTSKPTPINSYTQTTESLDSISISRKEQQRHKTPPTTGHFTAEVSPQTAIWHHTKEASAAPYNGHRVTTNTG